MIGVGNRFCGDDAAGLEVARLLRAALPPSVVVIEEEGEPAALLEAWRDAGEALVIDAMRSEAPVGTVHRFDPAEGSLPSGVFSSSTHALGLAEAVALGRELGRLPQRLTVYGIEGASFEAGEGLTPAVQTAVAELAREIREDLERRL